MTAVLRRTAPPQRKQNDWLVKKGYNITSQGGEDGVIDEIFKLLDVNNSYRRDKRYCVEFGAWDGKHLSNTWNLLHEQPMRWFGVLLEADGSRYEQMRENYKQFDNVACLNTLVGLRTESKTSDCLDEILRDNCALLPYELDLLSIDIDGADYHVWNDLVSYCPLVVVIEFNPTIPNNIIYIQERDIRVAQGSSLAALIELGKRKGYELICTTTFNAFFIRADLYDLFGIHDNDIDVMHDVPMPMEIFQLYDGTLKIAGCKKLIWKKMLIDEEKMQTLSKEDRQFALSPFANERIQERHEHVEAGQETSQKWESLMKCGHDAYGVTNSKEVRQYFDKALQVAKGAEQELATLATFKAYTKFAEHDLVRSQHLAATEWLHELLRIDPRCKPQARAYIFGQLGECYIRLRDYPKAEFYLQTARAIRSDDRKVLKSIVKLYSKLGNEHAKDEALQKLIQL